ncbi:DnaJ domain-containing protein [Desulfonema magnum]|uniref:Chaperone family protein n=1 Tax=Desulfonema magnum TaxID=45655 RepID=A0A975GQV1_9BACT|nr:DnaJ domain-containing protein [Desulfonema magnum]QTA89338.1 Chaperone family protein [Desulfonema magnum]
MEKDYYQILGVGQNAETKEIKEAYRQMAFKYHPDRNTENPDAAEKMKAVNEAYAVLSDPSKKREYDSLRQQFGNSAYNQFRKTYSDQDIFSGSDINQIFEEMAKAFGLRGFDDIFKEFYGQGYRTTFEFKSTGLFSGDFIFSGNFGKKENKSAEQPPKISYLNKLSRFVIEKVTGVELPENGADLTDMILLSPQQAQEGGPYAYFHKKKSKKLVVKIPPGIREGQHIRLSGMGEDGKGGGNPGDLYLKVQIRKPFIQKVQDFIFGPHK